MIRKLLTIVLSVLSVVYLWQFKLASTTFAPVYEQVIKYVGVLGPKVQKQTFPNDMVQNILEQLNSERVRNGLPKLTVSEELTKAAKARVAVIKLLEDFTGTVSGLTREKAYELVDYDTTYFGDLHIYLATPTDDYMSEILQNETKKEIVLVENFTEVGIAETEDGVYNHYYLLLGNRRQKATQAVAPKKEVVQKVTWSGPDLWAAVNKRRVEFGVNGLSKKDELCTIASIRLNQLLEINKLDGHAGFKPVLDRADLKWIGEKYNISEFLAQGYSSPEETIKGWENTLGHRSLLAGGEFVWGCIYSQNSFAVAITAY